MKFIDLFCGIGGFRLGLEKHGLQCVFSSDINEKAREAYEANFGEAPSGDITQINAADIPEHDIITAGFPCQSFSTAGNMKGFDDPRGQLFFEIIRIAKHHQPKFILLENVERLKSAENGAVLKRITAELDAIGYNLNYAILNASNFGVPQARKRFYGVAIRKDTNFTWAPPQETNEPCCVADIMLPDDQIPENFWVKNEIVITHPQNLYRKANEILRVGHILRLDGTMGSNEASQGYRLYGSGGVASTCSSHFGGVGAKTGIYTAPQGKRLFSTDGHAQTLAIGHCKKAGGGVYVKAGQSMVIASPNGHAYAQTASADKNHGIRTNGVYIKVSEGYELYNTSGVAATQKGNHCKQTSSKLYTETGIKARPLTNDEMKAVMGFPPTHIISKGSHGRSQCGNAVIPKMAELIYGSIGSGLL